MSINNGLSEDYPKQKYTSYSDAYEQAPPPYSVAVQMQRPHAVPSVAVSTHDAVPPMAGQMATPGAILPVGVQLPMQGLVYVEPPFKDEDPRQNIIDDETDGRLEFSDASIRRGFVRKVYSLLMLQIIVTAIITSFFMYNEGISKGIQNLAKNHPNKIVWIVLGIFGITLFVVFIMICYGEERRRKPPQNYIFLSTFTLSMSGFLGFIAALSRTDVVLVIAGISCGICLAMAIFTMQTKWDYTVWGGILVSFLGLLLGCGMLYCVRRITWPSEGTVFDRMVRDSASCLSILFFSFYLAYDTQLMMRGRHKYDISPEEYVFATLNLYLDILSFFIKCLRRVK